MSETKFSPGPWVARLSEEINVVAADDEWVALTAYADTDAEFWERSIADARLIASAPELYEALSEAPPISKYHTARGFEYDEFVKAYGDWAAKRNAALAKAGGRNV